MSVIENYKLSNLLFCSWNSSSVSTPLSFSFPNFSNFDSKSSPLLFEDCDEELFFLDRIISTSGCTEFFCRVPIS